MTVEADYFLFSKLATFLAIAGESDSNKRSQWQGQANTMHNTTLRHSVKIRSPLSRRLEAPCELTHTHTHLNSQAKQVKGSRSTRTIHAQGS